MNDHQGDALGGFKKRDQFHLSTFLIPAFSFLSCSLSAFISFSTSSSAAANSDQIPLLFKYFHGPLSFSLFPFSPPFILHSRSIASTTIVVAVFLSHFSHLFSFSLFSIHPLFVYYQTPHPYPSSGYPASFNPSVCHLQRSCPPFSIRLSPVKKNNYCYTWPSCSATATCYKDSALSPFRTISFHPSLPSFSFLSRPFLSLLHLILSPLQIHASHPCV